MTINVNDVADRVAQMCEPGDFDRDRWIGVCCDAVDEIKAMLKGEIKSSLERSRLTTAAAMLSFYRFVTIMYLNKPSSYSAGDVRMDFSEGTCENARRLWLEAKEAIADLTVTDKFEFRAVGCGGDGNAFTGF